MFKLMHKKLNKKGFTLAELLIVVAIVAILVAIAIPVFTKSLEEAQIRTNTANLRTTRAAAVEHILANWNKQETDDLGPYYREGATKHSTKVPGWYAIGKIDAAGNLAEVRVNVNWASGDYEVQPNIPDGIITTATDFSTVPSAANQITKVEVSANYSPEYYMYVYIKDTDIK